MECTRVSRRRGWEQCKGSDMFVWRLRYDRFNSVPWFYVLAPKVLMHVMVTSCRAAESGNFGGRAKASCRVGFRDRGRGRDADVWNPPGHDVLAAFLHGAFLLAILACGVLQLQARRVARISCLDPKGVCSDLSRGEDGIGGGCTGGFS